MVNLSQRIQTIQVSENILPKVKGVEIIYDLDLAEIATIEYELLILKCTYLILFQQRSMRLGTVVNLGYSQGVCIYWLDRHEKCTKGL